MRRITDLVIHHSAGHSGNVEEFRREHRSRKPPFVDIGYHEVIGNGNGMPDGHIASGRKHELMGAGVFGNNTGKLHVCMVGCFEKGHSEYKGPPSYKQWCALGHWLLVNAKRYGPDSKCAVPHIVGHREITIPDHATACPGNEVNLIKVRNWFKTVYPRHALGLDFPALGDYMIVNTPKGIVPIDVLHHELATSTVLAYPEVHDKREEAETFRRAYDVALSYGLQPKEATPAATRVVKLIRDEEITFADACVVVLNALKIEVEDAQ